MWTRPKHGLFSQLRRCDPAPDTLHAEFGPPSELALLSAGTGVSRSTSSFFGEFTRVEIWVVRGDAPVLGSGDFDARDR